LLLTWILSRSYEALMAVLKVVEYPHSVLKKQAKVVTTIGVKERRLIQDMVDTLYHEDGVGLAAPQVGISKRIIVISPRALPGEERVYLNPEILARSPEEELGLEGCLSLPGISGEVPRAKRIKFQAMDLNRSLVTEEAEGFRARVIQHEIDHLNGILLIDRLDFARKQVLVSARARL